MNAKSKTLRLIASVVLFACAITLFAALAIPSNKLAAQSRTNLGPEDPNKQITVTLWLNLSNKPALDALVRQMYDKKSPNYHHFLTMEQYTAQFAPKAEQAAAVRDFLAASNMTVTATDKYNHYVMAKGTVGAAQKAFNVQINRAMLNGAVHRIPSAKASVPGAAGAFVAAVQGLSDLGYQPHAIRASDPATGKPYAAVKPSSVGPDGLFFSGNCLHGTQTVNFVTQGAPGKFPKATYTGNRFGSNINAAPPNLPPCGYDSKELQTAYGLKPLYSHGLDGTGQTIVIVDAFGSDSITDDANLFSTYNGLPALTATNFTIYFPTGPASCPGGTCGWNAETSLDVEWAHSIAPGANIALVLGADNSFTNLDLANLFAIETQLGNVISNSFGIPEIVLVVEDPAELVVENGISEMAAALGINHDVSTGDSGDNLVFDTNDFGIPATSAGANADSPFATGVGGTSTFLNNGTITFQTGWGNNLTRIAEATPNPPTIPLIFVGFDFGAGGGASTVYPLPPFQAALGGGFRQTPDISMDADPFTGVEIFISPDGIPADGTDVEVIGGTSLSCPMFSAVWAIANQSAIAHGLPPLGQAAPILYQLPAGAITDVQVVTSSSNVTGTISAPPSPPVFYSATALVEPELPTTQFFSALYNSPFSTRWFVLSFGTDSSLSTGPGWDNVTGLGTPNGQTFVNAVVTAATP